MDHRYIGNASQIFDVRSFTFNGGKAEGVRGISVDNGAGLSFTVLPDRALDIYSLKYRGVNFAFQSPTGIVNPAYYNDSGAKWLRSFGGGFFITAGLQNIGNPDEATGLGLHGRIDNTPCENLCTDLADDGMSVAVKGTMREAAPFNARLSLTRTIRASALCNTVTLEDRIVNHGFKTEPLSVLYHFNLGYPLIAPDSEILLPSVNCVPRTPLAAEHLDSWREITEPAEGYEEMCYYHTLSENIFGVTSRRLHVGFTCEFNSDHGILDRLVQWKMFGCGDYVLGLEPASCTLEGQTAAIADGSQKFIEPGDTITNTLTFRFKDVI